MDRQINDLNLKMPSTFKPISTNNRYLEFRKIDKFSLVFKHRAVFPMNLT